MFGAADAALAAAPELSLRPILRANAGVQPIPKPLKPLIKQARLEGRIAFVVADMKTGEVLESLNAETPMPPASVAKALTATYALEHLTPGYRFRTRLVANGVVKDGVLDGDLVLVGGGDPTLDTDHLFDMAARLKETGLREVRGKLKVYGGAVPRVERIDDMQPDYLAYNPSISGLNLNYNRVFFQWRQQAGDVVLNFDARTEKIRPDVAIAKVELADRRHPLFVYDKGKDHDRWVVAREALDKDGGRWLPMRQPELYAGEVFQTVARSHGIELSTPVKTALVPDGTVLVEHISPAAGKMCVDMLKYSTNLTAEIMGLKGTAASGKGAADLESSGRHMAGWLARRFDVHDTEFVDHSGLGDGSRISAHGMVRFLNSADAQHVLRPMLKDFAVRGSKGANSPASVVAKTGTLIFVGALAGYITTADGRDLTFAIFTADQPRRDTLQKRERDDPKGSRAWGRRARRFQKGLIRRWAVLYSA